MAAPLASSIKTKNFSAKFQNILIFFSTYRRYFKHFFLLVDRTSIGIECVIIFHRFSLVYAKYFTVYFRRTIKFDARVANLYILYYIIIYQVSKFIHSSILLVKRGSRDSHEIQLLTA